MLFFGSDIPNGINSPRGRLAPSPTGYLHLGNAWAFWVAWLAARAVGGECVLRFEDIDPARSWKEYADAIRKDLARLGLDWDYGPDAPGGKGDVFWQSRRSILYANALRFLEGRGLMYPCYCTRKELRDIAGAPHVDDAGAPYPGICRKLDDAEKERLEAAGRHHSLRLCCTEDSRWRFVDAVMGSQEMTLTDCGGDFVLIRSDGVYAYQLAVVVDDIAMGVPQVVRGNDILVSTPRQMYHYSLFGADPPQYAHLPLVTDNEGSRLAKRHASLTLGALREAGIRPQTVLGWLAKESGLRKEFAPVTAAAVAQDFSFAAISARTLRLPPDPATFFEGAEGKVTGSFRRGPWRPAAPAVRQSRKSP